ncbi:MAG TPA: MarR family transcriptional regulator [Kofleriaceae bacterium]|nr:MarR family transcriptional regulator [Kofleriaceae bacterium]
MQQMWDVVHALDVRSKRMERTIGVTGPQRLVLRIVGQSPNKVASEIASTLGIHPSTLTGILARLEQRGALVREIDPEDRRRARFRLTAMGRKIDNLRKGTVEAAVRRSIARAGDKVVERTVEMLGILAEELSRIDE